MALFELISNHLCPYTQRAAIQLAEKTLAYERVYINLAEQSRDGFCRCRRWKVPLLRVRDAVVFETAVICELYRGSGTGVPLHPDEPLDRARHRGWAELASAIIADALRLHGSRCGDLRSKCSDLRAKFHWLERHLGDGPYLAGAFSSVDAAFAPVFRCSIPSIESATSASSGSCIVCPLIGPRCPTVQACGRRVVSDYSQRFWQYLLERGTHLSRLMPPQRAVR